MELGLIVAQARRSSWLQPDYYGSALDEVADFAQGEGERPDGRVGGAELGIVTGGGNVENKGCSRGRGGWNLRGDADGG